MKTRLDQSDELLAEIDARNYFERFQHLILNYSWGYRSFVGGYKGEAAYIFNNELNRLIDQALPR